MDTFNYKIIQYTPHITKHYDKNRILSENMTLRKLNLFITKTNRMLNAQMYFTTRTNKTHKKISKHQGPKLPENSTIELKSYYRQNTKNKILNLKTCTIDTRHKRNKQ